MGRPKRTLLKPPSTLSRITDELVDGVADLRFGPPVTYVYNPLVYAHRLHDTYLGRYGQPPKECLLVGMNPGPFGMAQTGVPFGEVNAVRDWMGLKAAIGRPEHEHPKRPVRGLDCPRSEVSGARLWGWAEDRYGSAAAFFRRFFVINYCPLAFMTVSGRNLTPDKLPASERDPLFEACDRALRRTVEFFQPSHVVGIGRFAESRVREASKGLGITVGRMPHPSPASPAANRGWAAQADKALRSLGLA